MEQPHDNMLKLTPEVFIKLLNEYIEQHPEGKQKAISYLCGELKLAERTINYYRKGKQEPNLTNFLIMLDLIGREVYTTKKE